MSLQLSQGQIMKLGTYVSLPQTVETLPTLVKRGLGQGASYRYAYARSADTRTLDQRGQDYLVLQSISSSMAFALCDGVSQSFFGDIAARLLGNSLLGWLLEGLPTTLDPETIREGLSSHLRQLTAQGTKAVQNYQLPQTIPAMLQEVLEQKRASGSDSTFVCGRIDQPSEYFPSGRVVLAWMGDSRLRVWGHDGMERTTELGDAFKTEQRWSSARGPVNGEPNIVISLLTHRNKYALSRILAYSDGLSSLDRWQESLANKDLQLLIDEAGRATTSDDVSLLEIWTDPGFKLSPPGRVKPGSRSDISGVGGPVSFNFAPVFSGPGPNKQPLPLLRATTAAQPPTTEALQAVRSVSTYAGRTSNIGQIEQSSPAAIRRSRKSTQVAYLAMVIGLGLLMGSLAALAVQPNGSRHSGETVSTPTITPDSIAVAFAQMRATLEALRPLTIIVRGLQGRPDAPAEGCNGQRLTPIPTRTPTNRAQTATAPFTPSEQAQAAQTETPGITPQMPGPVGENPPQQQTTTSRTTDRQIRGNVERFREDQLLSEFLAGYRQVPPHGR